MSQKHSEKPDHVDLNIKLFELFRDYSKHEDSLVNNRLTWILAIHGFLYATYGLTLQKKMEVVQKIATDITNPEINKLFYASKSGLCSVLQFGDTFLWGISWIGFGISICGFLSIGAAVIAQFRLKRIYEDQYPIHSSEVGDNQKEKATWFLVLSDFWRMLNAAKTVKIGNLEAVKAKTLLLPAVAGGGHPAAVWIGIVAPLVVPAMLGISWIMLLSYSGEHATSDCFYY